jgi:hypothetical protein
MLNDVADTACFSKRVFSPLGFCAGGDIRGRGRGGLPSHAGRARHCAKLHRQGRERCAFFVGRRNDSVTRYWPPRCEKVGPKFELRNEEVPKSRHPNR